MKKLSDRCWHRVLCPHCDGVGETEYAHWVDDLTVDGGQREVIETLKCHICDGEGTLIGIPAAVAEAHDAVVEAARTMERSQRGTYTQASIDLGKAIAALDTLEAVRDGS